MKIIFYILVCILFPFSVVADLPVFPSCEGFGCDSFGGSGRHLSSPSTQIIKVTNLNDSGSGSLRACVQASGPRVCIFEVSGLIDLSSQMTSTSDYLTIAGQTAPSPGITVRGARFAIKSKHTYVTNIAFRPLDGPGDAFKERDGITLWGNGVSGGVHHVVLDHLSITHGIDENLSTYGTVTESTISNSLIAEGLNRNNHPENEMKSGVYIGHSMGALIDKGNSLTFYRNILASNLDRNIRTKEGETIEFVNNYVTGWGRFSNDNYYNQATSTSAAGNKVHFIGNYYKRTSAAVNDHPCISASNVPSTTKIFGLDNVCPGGTLTNLPGSMLSGGPLFPASIANPILSENVLGALAPSVGSFRWDRSPIDSRIISEVISGVCSLKDCMFSCNTNPDGTVDVSAGTWENITSNTRTLNVPLDPFSLSERGYTNLEEWLFQFVGQEVPTPIPSPTFTSSPTPTETPVEDVEPTETPTETPTPSPTGTVAMCLVPCSSLTPVPVPTSENTATATPTCTVTPTNTATATITNTPLPTNTSAPTRTATPTKTPTVKPSPTPSCVDRLNECASICPNCASFLAGTLPGYPYSPGYSCSAKSERCKVNCSNCPNLYIGS